MAEDWLTTTQAGQLVGYHARHVTRLAQRGLVKARHFDRDWQVDRASLLAYHRAVQHKGAKRGPKSIASG